LPVLAAAQIARDLRQTAYLAVGISLSAMVTGILLSFFLDIPPSATVTLLLVGTFGILK
jgi:zinc transport system permease protein